MNKSSLDQIIAIDIGGTFTDIVYSDKDGLLRRVKRPSTRADPSAALLGAVQTLIGEGEVSAEAINGLIHGTTVATNAMIERTGAKTGIITTKGFRDVLEIGRQGRQDLYGTILKPQTPVFLAPRGRRLEVTERVTAAGDILVPLDHAEAIQAIDALAADGCEAIAVVLLFSFANPSHERQIGQLIAERHPNIKVSLSCDVDPTFREYERTCATAFDAYVKPLLDVYLNRIEDALKETGVTTPLQVIHSRGGLCSSEVARRRPVRLVLSGPAAGVIAGAETGMSLGRKELVTIDIGGTSSDIALVMDGKPLVQNEGRISDFPVRVPMADIHVIGAGGGSVAFIDAGGALAVGPRSAGAEPGPACYGRGGTEPTVTDASLILGYLDPEQFGGGSLVLDAELARAAIRDHIAEPLGISVEQAALGIHRVLNAQMAAAIRLMSVNRGIDPRCLSLVAMGGAGPLHAAKLVEDLGVAEAIIPLWPGVGSAVGLLSAPVEHEMLVARPMLLKDADIQDIAETIKRLDADVTELMALDQVPKGKAHISHSADVCFVGQAYTLEIPIDEINDGLIDRIYETFVDRHREVYGHAARTPARIVNLRTVHSWRPERNWRIGDETSTSPARERPLIFEGQADAVLSPVIARNSLGQGAQIAGPLVLEQKDSTVLLPPGWVAEVVGDKALIITKGEVN